MAKKALARVAELVGVNFEHDEDSAPCVFREREASDEWLFQGKDERGCEGWFLRLDVTGMYSRRVGPLSTKEEALELLEDFVHGVLAGPLCEIGNISRGNQACVMEGVPRLAAAINER